MKLNKSIKLIDLLLRNIDTSIKYEIIGDSFISVEGINDYQVAQENDITWVDFEPLYNKAFISDASVIIINKLPDKLPLHKVLIITENPLRLFDSLLAKNIKQIQKKTFFKQYLNKKYVTGVNCRIYKGVKIGRDVVIGNDCTIYPNVVIYDNTIIGDNVVIHANSVVGADPFAYIKQTDNSYYKREPYGRVIILDNVEIGALCTIDKGITCDTIIGCGTKTDDQIHIGHDVWVGSNCFFSGQVAIAGYVRIKNNCVFWGKSGVISSISVCNNTTLLASSIIFKDVKEENTTLFGIPAEKSLNYWKGKAKVRNLINENK